jgi:uncharacterized membrane protein
MDHPHSTAQIGGHPIHPMLVPFPIAFLVGTFICDLVFRANGNVFWATAAYWCLVAGLVGAAAAAVAGLIDFLGDRRIRLIKPAWWHMVGNVIAVVLSLLSFWLRHRTVDGIYPSGLWISLIVVLILLFTGWQGGELVFRHRVAVLNDPLDRR